MQALRLKVPRFVLFFVANRFWDAVVLSCFCFFAGPGVALLWLSWMLTLSMSTATQMFDHAKNRRSFLLIY